MPENRSGTYDGELYTVEKARSHYRLGERDSLFASDLDTQLIENGIANIEMPISESDFRTLIDSFETCIGECPEVLTDTYYKHDTRHGNEAGYERKQRKIDPTTGLQTQDPKHLIHFTEKALERWTDQFTNTPSAFADFLANGFEAHAVLIALAKAQFAELEETHPSISKAYFPVPRHALGSLSFMRVISYDSYNADLAVGEVAKPHFDIGGATIQAYADAPGFWGAKDGRKSERVHYDSNQGYGQFFMGIGHKKLYGQDCRLRPLYHGVDRIVPEGQQIVPQRHAVILFIDAPFINYDVTPKDTLPELANVADSEGKYIAAGN